MFEATDNGVLWVGQVGLFGRRKKEYVAILFLHFFV